MQPAYLDMLKSRYRFHEWRLAGRARESLFVRNYRTTGDELPNRLITSRAVRLNGVKRLNVSTWEPLDAIRERPLVVDVLEHAAREQAHESLIQLTGQFHRPIPLNVRLDHIGEVCVETPDGAWFAFARGNVVVRIMSGIGLSAPAPALATRLDEALMSRPSQAAELSGEAAFDLPGAAAPARPNAVRLSMGDLKAPDAPPEEQPYVKVFSRGGTVVLEEHEDDLILIPEAPAVEIAVYVMDPGGRWTGRRYQGPPIRGFQGQNSDRGD